MKLRFLIALSSSLFLHHSFGEEVEKAPFEILKTTDGFYDTAVGIAGITPKEVEAFRTLLNGEDADTVFKKLLDEATVGGQLYALCGIYYTDPETFDNEVERYAKSTKEVKTMIGCIVTNRDVATLVRQSRPGTVRLESREQTIKEWAEAHRDELKSGMHYDIFGGGWPNKFKEEGGYRSVSSE